MVLLHTDPSGSMIAVAAVEVDIVLVCPPPPPCGAVVAASYMINTRDLDIRFDETSPVA